MSHLEEMFHEVMYSTKAKRKGDTEIEQITYVSSVITGFTPDIPFAVYQSLLDLGYQVSPIPKKPFDPESTTDGSITKRGTLYPAFTGTAIIVTGKDSPYPISQLHIIQDDGGTKLTVNSKEKDGLNFLCDKVKAKLASGFRVFKGEPLALNRDTGISFMSGIDKIEQPIFSDQINKTLGYSIYTPIQLSGKIADGEFKRGVLLSGTYGMGKSSVAAFTAKLAQGQGITFIYLQSAKDLAYLSRYVGGNMGRCVIFVEDIDKLFSEDRDSAMDDLINSLDSVDNKKQDTLTIFTTNELEVIDRAVLRPGRIDSIIELELPNKQVMTEILLRYTNGNTSAVYALIESLREGERYSPAVLREVAMRAYYHNLSLNKSQEEITGQDLIDALHSLKPQVNLVNKAKPKDEVQKQVAHGVYQAIDNLLNKYF